MSFCKICGAPFPNESMMICGKCGCPKGKGSAYCSQCGRPLMQGAYACGNCGMPTGMAPAQPQTPVDPNAKSKITAGILGIFLGSFGVHNFYLGYTKKAIIQLVPTLLFFLFYLIMCVVMSVLTVTITDTQNFAYFIPLIIMIVVCVFIGLLFMAVRIWTLVEAILILCGKITVDGKGNPLSK